jgi:hypothetical protein
MGFAEAAAVLRKALQSEDLGADGRLDQATCRFEHAAQRTGCAWYQTLQLA